MEGYPLFTIISLMIGIFGASYAGLNTLKNFFQNEAQRKQKEAEKKNDKVQNSELPQKSKDKSEKFYNIIDANYNRLKWIFVFVTLYFTVWIYLIAILFVFGVSIYSANNKSCRLWFCEIPLIIFLFLSFLGGVFYYQFYKRENNHYNRLVDIYDSIGDGEGSVGKVTSSDDDIPF
jgi:uncharacterized membrane protein (DUF106 family)